MSGTKRARRDMEAASSDATAAAGAASSESREVPLSLADLTCEQIIERMPSLSTADLGRIVDAARSLQLIADVRAPLKQAAEKLTAETPALGQFLAEMTLSDMRAGDNGYQQTGEATLRFLPQQPAAGNSTAAAASPVVVVASWSSGLAASSDDDDYAADMNLTGSRMDTVGSWALRLPHSEGAVGAAATAAATAAAKDQLGQLLFSVDYSTNSDWVKGPEVYPLVRWLQEMGVLPQPAAVMSGASESAASSESSSSSSPPAGTLGLDSAASFVCALFPALHHRASGVACLIQDRLQEWLGEALYDPEAE